MKTNSIKTKSKINKNPIKTFDKDNWSIKWDNELIYIRQISKSKSSFHLFIWGYSYRSINKLKNEIIYKSRLNKILIGSTIKNLINIDEFKINYYRSYLETDILCKKTDKVIIDKLVSILCRK